MATPAQPAPRRGAACLCALAVLALLGCARPATAHHAAGGPLPPAPPPAAPEPAQAPPQPAPPRPGIPKRLRIPTLHIDAAVVPVDLDADGAMGVPPDGQTVGWYLSGSRPGEPGNSLLDGHVDWKGNTAAFWRLHEVRPGDAVEVVSADGALHPFQVVWVRSLPAETTDLAPVFGPTAQPGLTLITCTGSFDHDRHQYTQRLVVRAELAGTRTT